MSARLRSSLHPLTVASIDMQDIFGGDCGCHERPTGGRPYLCEYHQGFQDGIDALLESEGRSDG